MRTTTQFLLWLVIAIFFPLFACNNENSPEISADEFNVSIDLPKQATVTKSERICTFSLTEGQSLKESDTFILESDNGISYICPLVKVEANNFSVKIPKDCESGYYNVSIKRNNRKKSEGRIYINLIDKLDFTLDKGTTAYGIVSSEEGGIKGVVVSDGEETTTTNEQGIYQLKSKKKNGYVFISIPANYEVASDGILPLFYKSFKDKSNADTAERIDFSLNKVSGQDDYKVFFLGDMHLANRTNDNNQFKDFTDDFNSYRNRFPNKKMYAITLGDMTWDLYWYNNKYSIPEYLNTMNSQVKGIQIFHTIGNHDFDYKATSDFEAGSKFRTNIAPLYYSFNIGKVHYVVMDDIDCSKYDGTTSRAYEVRISTEQLNWLAKDLSYVDKETPLIVVMHAPVFATSEKEGFTFDHDELNTAQLFSILKDYKVHFVSGHTHRNYNVLPQHAVTGGHEFYEHNTAAICASWWWSGYLTPGVHISLDGAPGGYGIWDIAGKDFKYIYKTTGRNEDYQFRTYDLNNVHFSMADVPSMPTNVPDAVKEKYMQYVNAYPANSNNEVLINIWNWNPRWTLTVTDEKGNNLTPKEVWAYDPLHIAALSVKRFNSAKLKSTPAFITEKAPHFFKVKAGDANTDLTITVKDEFGHTWTENMQRPKAFSIDTYKAN